jgi:O-antigen/teichoic acid export membrane protein
MQLVTTIVLARLLRPSDFGQVGMAMILIGFVALFRDLGTSAAVVQRKNVSEELLSSLFWGNLAFGFFAMAVLCWLSPPAGNLFHESEIVRLLRALSLTIVISSLSILHQAILERDLAFHRLARAEASAVLLGSLVGIGSALLGAGAWSLIFQSLTVATVTTVILWTSSPWRPKLIFRWAELKSIGGYSLNLTGFNIFNYLVRNADNLLIGRFFGAQELGYYNLAYRLMFYPLQNISDVIGRVMFPAYSQMQRDDARFRRTYLKVAGTIPVITFPMMLGLMATSDLFIKTVFGAQWAPAIPLLIILAPVGLVQSVSTTVGQIYQAKGRTDWMLRWGIIAGFLVLVAFAIGIRSGAIGIAISYAVASAILIVPSFAIPFRLIKLRVRDLGTVLWQPLLSSLVMVSILLGLRIAMPTRLCSEQALGILIPVGIFVYALSSWRVNREQMGQLLGIVGIKV